MAREMKPWRRQRISKHQGGSCATRYDSMPLGVIRKRRDDTGRRGEKSTDALRTATSISTDFRAGVCFVCEDVTESSVRAEGLDGGGALWRRRWRCVYCRRRVTLVRVRKMRVPTEFDQNTPKDGRREANSC